ncbi:flagellin [Desulfosarcina cetonica]|uniref:flagellin N-terminal helical domain-containing protein n=1 Tax=Desulfosarcina cetonica TaxID=90730 RepID=UPI0006D07745|nr:flagellin [Desulfosarcina cetonica]
MAKQSTQLSKTQIQIATGKRINSLSDDPKGIGRVLGYRSTLSRIDQYQSNITDAMNRVAYTETILGQINELVEDAKGIASNYDGSSSEALAQSVGNIRDQILGLANSRYGDDYLLSGDMTSTAPFDATSGDYNGDNGSYGAIIGDGITITLAADGGEMLTDAASTDTVLAVLDDLVVALRDDNQDDVRDALEPLQNIDDQLELVRSNFAAAYSRLKDTQERWEALSNAVETMRSKTEDADVTEAAVDLQLQQTSYELLLQVASEVLQPTLLDFLG